MAITGAGWIDSCSYGQWKRQCRQPYVSMKELRDPEKEIFRYPVKNFGRFDEDSRMMLCAVALALQDAGIDYAEDKTLDIGLIGTSRDGALQANTDYFKDFVDCGKILGRGNLFMYTLPSSPLAEAAIHFKLCGPLQYADWEQDALGGMALMASLMIHDGQASMMALVVSQEDKACCYLVDGDQDSTISDLDALRNIEHIDLSF